MKHRNLILIISILVFASCKEITKDDIKGNWIAFPSGYDEPTFWEINFKEDKVELIGDNLYKEIGEYQVENEKIKIELKRDDLTLETEIQNLEVDTLLIFDSLIYHRNREIANFNFEEYGLIGIETKEYLSEVKNFYHVIHYYKTTDNEIRVRIGNKITNLDVIPFFLSSGHTNSSVVVYIGKGITLKDLNNLYYRLASVHQLRIILGLKREGFSNTHIFTDRIEIWWDELKDHLAKLPKSPPLYPPPPNEFTSKENYLMKRGKEVEIFTIEDFDKINNLENDERYVVSLSASLPIEDYIELRKLVFAKKRMNNQIITEIR